ncbi:hypothetical protein L204_100206 [Cryptococcus depauperatus]|nr:cation-transporting ATPase 13A3/4/5 [Cryptococcus depauperatus CBS 7855]
MIDPSLSAFNNIPSAISASRPTPPDVHHPVFVPPEQRNLVSSTPRHIEQEDPGPSNYDYTENAPQADVDAVAIAREKQLQEGGPPEMMIGSWAGSDDNNGTFPSSITRRRASIASRHSMSSNARPSGTFRRQGSSQFDLLQSPTSQVLTLDDDDDERGIPRHHVPHRKGSRRRTRRDSNGQPESYFSFRGSEGPLDHTQSLGDQPAELRSPANRVSALGKIASFMRLNRGDIENEETRHTPYNSRHSYSRSRSRQGSTNNSSYLSQPSSGSSGSDDGWGFGEEDEDLNSYGEGGEEGYTSSLADDTSLPPRSRPGSPNMPLVPSGTDGIFGDPGARLYSLEEPSDFASLSISSRQTILLPDEDLSARFTCYKIDSVRTILWWSGCILTLGVLGLLGKWMPRIWIKFVGKETAFDEAKKNSCLIVETPYGDIHIIPIQIVPYPYPLSTVFPQSVLPTVALPDVSCDQTNSSTPVQSTHITNGKLTCGSGGAKDLMHDIEPGKIVWEETTGLLKITEYRYTKFALDPTTGRWAMIRDWRDPKWTSNGSVAQGLDSFTREQRFVLMGQNIIDIASKSVLGLLIDEILHPFYIFQIASIILWSLDNYYYYAFAIALISVASIMSTLIETKRTIERMRAMSKFHCDVKVLVDGEWIMMDCSKMVPGDIFDASDSNLTVFPCDALLLSGDAIINESMLTGESVPVSKIPAKDEVLRNLSREFKQGSSEIDSDLAKHYLFAGTKIIRVRAGAKPMWAPKSEQPIALAMVTRTGFNTTKGALVRSMLFPKPMGFKFYRDSMNFIGVLTIIAGLGFAISAVQFIRIGIAWHTIMIRALDLITIVVPPALPATLTIGTTFAIERLRKSGIFCISPNRVNVGGKINVVCFDKTGTLTEDGLDVLGVRTIDRQDKRFSELHSDIAEVPVEGGPDDKTPLLHALATCHALKLIDGEIIGDPLDIKMFEYTRWTLDEGQSRPVTRGSVSGGTRPQALVQTVVRPPGTDRWRMEDALKQGGKHAHFLELGVIRTFDFVSALRRMSVVVKRLKSSSMEIYVKGAPEVMADICDPLSFPLDYEDMLSYYTRNGFRVIAIAGKSMGGMTWLKAQRMRRDMAESGLQFLGFIVFENKLKPATAPNIHILRAAHLACRMVTGDNVRTAISVARECGLVSHSASVYIPTFIPNTGVAEDARLDWSSVDDDSLKLDEWSLKPLANQEGVAMDTADAEMHDYQLALTGDIFKWILEYAEYETMERMLVKGVIFARMSPDEKAELVERLQALGYTVAFCGDGANDCGALKAADVGVSLSEAEASVAAPFTSRIPDISCMVEIIKEGRAALVTSFSCFKYMALYSMIQFVTVTLLYSFASSLGDFQFLYIDLFIVIPIAVAMGRTLPYPKIHPKRPTASLVSRKVLISIIGQIVINTLFQMFVFLWVRRQPWYTKPDTNIDKLETFNYENSALFLASCFQYILVAGVFSVGPPYRKPLYTNPTLVICLLVLVSFSTYVLLSPANSIALILDIIHFNFSFKLQLLLIVLVNVAASSAFEKFGERPISRLIVSMKRWKWRRERKRDYKPLERLDNGAA